jgi:hypothetical protein
MKKDERKISLDPMEWRDAMKDVAKTPPKKPAKKKPAAKKKVSGSRR